MKICIIQTDDRTNLNYLKLSMAVNKIACEKLSNEFDISYKFILNTTDEVNVHGATRKILTLLNFMNSNKDIDVIIFLDSDAWIQSVNKISQLFYYLINNKDVNGMFSRDLDYDTNTYINSGSFIIRNNDFVRGLWKQMKEYMLSDNSFHFGWPWDQWYVSEIIYKNREKFIIFRLEILNSPVGEVLRHNWWKDNKMYNDLNTIIKNGYKTESLCNIEIYNIKDNKPFPNTRKRYDYASRI